MCMCKGEVFGNSGIPWYWNSQDDFIISRAYFDQVAPVGFAETPRLLFISDENPFLSNCHPDSFLGEHELHMAAYKDPNKDKEYNGPAYKFPEPEPRGIFEGGDVSVHLQGVWRLQYPACGGLGKSH